MGTYATKFRQDNHSALPNRCHPSKSDWITAHAVATKLAIVEVERLWKRFEQLGCNKDGLLTNDVLQKHPIAQDIFSKNILTILRSDDGSVKFITFLNCMQWAENASQDQKIAGIFQLLNNSQPVTRDIMFKIIVRMYPDENKEEQNRVTDILMDQLGANASNGVVTQQQFVERVKLLPPEITARMFGFLIVPQEINEEAHRTFTSLSKGTAPGGRGNTTSVIPEEPEPDFSKQIPSDTVLLEVSKKIHQRDWHVLANKLEFMEADIRDFERRNDTSSVDQVFDMLKAWRHRDGSIAYAETLEKALQQCNMNDAAMLLYP